MVGPQGLHFCKSDFCHLWPTAQNVDILGPTIQQLKLSSQCHQYVVLRFFFWMWFCVSFFEMVLRFFFWRVYLMIIIWHDSCKAHVSLRIHQLRRCTSTSVELFKQFFIIFYDVPLILLGPQKVSGFWSSVGFKIGAGTRLFFGHLFPPFFGPTGKYVIHCIRRDQIVQSTVAKRGLTNRANVHTPMWTSN